ncbi:lipopolysaccharide biosynthesis protein [Methylobacterium sp. J-068]|uniref:lipopolysaccharide biosynthesis protein n=1 Tax=Methylobacterium sp. J-068 TaxID=2836649 RepID=UPI001FB8B435|nr:oligosaccharide flippase family protein [Methylobacterium sp. J-068]MCJ2033702.1 oligosaccharide flippase family protein [Methylobacterium sp. J-068]
MIARHTLIYVGSRGVAAGLNMAALAVFTRLAPTNVFGLYLLILSWALVLYSATCQWPKFSFFALYAEDRAALQVGTVVRLLGAMGLIAGLSAAGAAALGLVAPGIAAAIVVAVFGMMAFEGAAEIARTRLEVGAVSRSLVLRAVLVLAFGSAALLLGGDAVALLLATALANMLAAIPSLLAIRALLRGPGDWGEARRLLAYGWPLVLSFAAAALAQTVDRLVIGTSIGVAELGAYGAFADFLRQSFVMFGDSIALALVSIAKRQARDGGMQAARPVLEDAARLLAVIAAFGAVFFLSFDDLLVGILLGPDYRETALRVAPLLITASILQMLRSYYFGQVIYFTPTSHLDAVASVTLLAVIGGLSAVLVPRYGVEGAAIALAVGQAMACLVFLFGSRDGDRMPVPVRDVAVIAGAAILCGLILAGLDHLPVDARATLALKLVCLALVSAVTAWAFNILGLADLAARRFARAA